MWRNQALHGGASRVAAAERVARLAPADRADQRAGYPVIDELRGQRRQRLPTHCSTCARRRTLI